MYCNTIHFPLQYPSFPLQYTFISLAIQFLSLLASLIAIQFPVLQYNSLYCNTIFQPLSPPIAIHFLSQKDYIAIQSVSHQAPLAIHFPSLTKVAIQCLGLQYNCNTMVQPNLHHFFFRFFLFFFKLFLATGKTPKKKYIHV